MFLPFYSRRYKKYFTPKDNYFECGELKVPVIDGIPRFVSSGSYASLFGEQWKKYRRTQLDSFSGLPITETRLNRVLGPLQNDLAGKLVLEAGCGAGRFTEILLKKNAKLVSADISAAVEVNIENFPVSANHIGIQADINDMPFADETFDVVVCLGVIQHTPDPEQTIRNLFQLVKKGGTLLIDHYSFSRSAWFRLATIYRWFLKRKPAAKTIPYTQKLVNRYLPLHKKVRGNKLLSVLLNRISPITSYYDAFPGLDDNQQREWAMLDTHDSLTDWYKHYRNPRQIRSILARLGATGIWCERRPNGLVEARCNKPQ
jgi:2-polyprenyl-3-methyl-5-hydroxy-6-metoxy-1,4-benzoquinol methylase